MLRTLLTLLLSIQLTAFSLPCSRICSTVPDASAQPSRLWWGLIDPEMSLWFSHLPLEPEESTPVLWDWSWKGLLAALFGNPKVKEATGHVPAA